MGRGGGAWLWPVCEKEDGELGVEPEKKREEREDGELLMCRRRSGEVDDRPHCVG